jgi:hypothetical protein
LIVSVVVGLRARDRAGRAGVRRVVRVAMGRCP